MKHILLIFAAPLFFTSCTLTDMPLREGVEAIDLETGPIALFSLHSTKSYKPKHQARLGNVKVDGESGKKMFQGQWGDVYMSGYLGDTVESLQSFQLEPGEYTLKSIGGGTQHFKPPGKFTCAVGAKFELQPHEVVYIGRIDMRCRKRVGDEPRAGGLFPLIDQAIVGYAGGTWDVAIEDQYFADLIAFRRDYPFLKDVEITKRLMVIPEETE